MQTDTSSNISSATSADIPCDSHTTRLGKIARLPAALRQTLNRRLEDHEPSQRLVDWLNSLPEVRQVLKDLFEGRPISEQNLSAWKLGGFRDWQRYQQCRARARGAQRAAGPGWRPDGPGPPGALPRSRGGLVAAQPPGPQPLGVSPRSILDTARGESSGQSRSIKLSQGGSRRIEQSKNANRRLPAGWQRKLPAIKPGNLSDRRER